MALSVGRVAELNLGVFKKKELPRCKKGRLGRLGFKEGKKKCGG